MSKRLLPLAALALTAACAQQVPLTSVQVTEPVNRGDGIYRGTVMNNSDITVQQLHFVNRYIAPDGVVVEENTPTAHVHVPSGQRRSYSFFSPSHGDIYGEWRTARATWTLVRVTD
jgi:hypothetical protein